jgi:hypothetical protein
VAEAFEERYPNIAAWIREHEGWIEVGCDEHSSSLIRVFDLGGLVWESNKQYASIDDALTDADRVITDWLASN